MDCVSDLFESVSIFYRANITYLFTFCNRLVLQSAFKTNILNIDKLSLNLEEMLIALGISATTNPSAQVAMEHLKEISGTEVHITHIPSLGDEVG